MPPHAWNAAFCSVRGRRLTRASTQVSRHLCTGGWVLAATSIGPGTLRALDSFRRWVYLESTYRLRPRGVQVSLAAVAGSTEIPMTG